MMRALLVAIVVSSVGGAVRAQTGTESLHDLESCFQAARGADAICANPANEPAQRLECFENARKAQLECMEHVIPGTSAGAAAPATSTGTATSEPVNATVIPEQPVAIAPPAQPTSASPPKVAAGATASDPPAAVADAPAKQPDTDWVVSETTSPVDFSPLITAVTRSMSGANALVISCRGLRTELSLRTSEAWRSPRGGEIQLAYQINDQPVVKLSWAQSQDGKTARFKEDAAGLMRAIPEGARLKISVIDGPDSGRDASFQFAGIDAIRRKIETVCKGTPAAIRTSNKPVAKPIAPKQLVTVGKPATAGRSSSPAPAAPLAAPPPRER